MSENSKIEWCDHTFNPWVGCTKVSPGCANCYAETQDKFRSWTTEGWGKGKPRQRTSIGNWKLPLKWNRAAEKAGTRPRVFCASLADWLDDEVPIEWLADLLQIIALTPHLDWLLLSKRLEDFWRRIDEIATCEKFEEESYTCAVGIAREWAIRGNAPKNVWMGTSVENQLYAEERIPLLLGIPAKVRFLSCEPLLGPVDLRSFGSFGTYGDPGPEIDWIIAGGESGSCARPMHPDWARSLRDQCKNVSSFLFKQWGEFLPICQDDERKISDGPATLTLRHDGAAFSPDEPMGFCCSDCSAVDVIKVGKSKAGRLLDGREWNEFPKGGLEL